MSLKRKYNLLNLNLFIYFFFSSAFLFYFILFFLLFSSNIPKTNLNKNGKYKMRKERPTTHTMTQCNNNIKCTELSKWQLLVKDMLNKWGGASLRKMNRNPNSGVGGMKLSYDCYL